MHCTRLRTADSGVWPDITAVIASGTWTADHAPPQRLRRTFLDTFDGRLLRRGQVVELEQRRNEPVRLNWNDRATAGVLGEAVLSNGPEGRLDGSTGLFAWDLPPGRLADDLGPLLDERALLPYAAITTGRQVIGVRDRQAKLIARIVVDDDTLVEADGAPRRRPLGRSARVQPLRGYERQAERLTRWLLDETALVADEDGESDALARVLTHLDVRPGGVGADAGAALEPGMRSLDAAVVIFRRLLATIEANRQGTIDELDTEFLHDLRVAVRRTRSGLKAFGGIFRPAPLTRFAPGFRWVQQSTGAARDLDVQLLEFADEVRKLTPDAAERLQPLRTLLEGKHRAAHRETNRALRAARFTALVERWRTFLDAPPPGPDADQPIVDVASERIWRAYRRLVKPGRRITEASPAEDLHDLRKRAKELRYLLEFFAPLYPKAEIAPLVRELKNLQDNLGAIQDDQVQATGLRSYAAELLALTTTPETLIALGELVAHHERTSHEARIEFAERFATFDRRANRASFAALFCPVPAGSEGQ